MNLREMLASVSAKMAAIIAAAEGAKRALTAEEQKQFDDLRAEASRLEKDIERADAAARLQAQMAAPQPPAVARPSGATGGTLASAKDPKFGFSGFGAWLRAVRGAAFGTVDERLMNAITTYGAEGVGADGGFAVPPEFSSQIAELVSGEGSLLGMLSPIPVSSNQLVVPTDETTPHGTAGIIAEWLAEGGAMTARKPVLTQKTVNLHKVGALVYMSDELLEDAPAMQSYLTSKIGSAITGKVNEALVAGDGVSKPLGFKNAPGIVTQAKSGSTIAAIDLAAMRSRLIPSALAGAFWLVHSSALPKLWTLVLGQQPIMIQNMNGSPNGLMLGLPIVTSEYCSDYNTLGDILLVSPAGYIAAVKSGGARSDASIHFAFDQGVQAFRTTMRVGGLPIGAAAVARKNGTTTLSHIVQLEVRS